MWPPTRTPVALRTAYVFCLLRTTHVSPGLIDPSSLPENGAPIHRRTRCTWAVRWTTVRWVVSPTRMLGGSGVAASTRVPW